MIKLKTMTKGARRPLNLFFAEIIIALLFFSISSAVILKVFAAADVKSRNSAELERVIITAQSIAEAYSRFGDTDKTLETVFGESVPGTRIALDNSCAPDENGNILLELSENKTEDSAGVLSSLTMNFSREGKTIFSLDCAAYIPKGGAS